MKRRMPGGEPDDERYVKRRRQLELPEYEELSEDQLNFMHSFVSEIVGQYLGQWMDVGHAEPDVAHSFFFGQPQDFIEQSLFAGEQDDYVFGTPDDSVPGTPESSDDEFEYVPETPQAYQDESDFAEVAQVSLEGDSDEQQEMDEDFLADPEQYAWDLAMEMSNEIIDELYDESAAEDDESMADGDVKQEILKLPDINDLQVEICQAIYEDILEEWSISYAS